MEEVDSTFEIAKPIDEAVDHALSTVGVGVGRWNYRIATHTARAIVFTRTYRQWIVWVLVVILFPFGLLFLFARQTAVLALAFTPSGDTTQVRVTGDAPRKLRDYFEELETVD